jgi:hypothetical protein
MIRNAEIASRTRAGSAAAFCADVSDEPSFAGACHVCIPRLDRARSTPRALAIASSPRARIVISRHAQRTHP